MSLRFYFSILWVDFFKSTWTFPFSYFFFRYHYCFRYWSMPGSAYVTLRVGHQLSLGREISPVWFLFIMTWVLTFGVMRDILLQWAFQCYNLRVRNFWLLFSLLHTLRLSTPGAAAGDIGTGNWSWLWIRSVARKTHRFSMPWKV